MDMETSSSWPCGCGTLVYAVAPLLFAFQVQLDEMSKTLKLLEDTRQNTQKDLAEAENILDNLEREHPHTSHHLRERVDSGSQDANGIAAEASKQYYTLEQQYAKTMARPAHLVFAHTRKEGQLCLQGFFQTINRFLPLYARYALTANALRVHLLCRGNVRPACPARCLCQKRYAVPAHPLLQLQVTASSNAITLFLQTLHVCLPLACT